MTRNTKVALYIVGGAAGVYFIVLPLASFVIGTIAGGTAVAAGVAKVAGSVPFTGQIQPKRAPKGGAVGSAVNGVPGALLPSNTAQNDRGGGSGSNRAAGGITDPGYDAMAPNRYVSRDVINVTPRAHSERA